MEENRPSEPSPLSHEYEEIISINDSEKDGENPILIEEAIKEVNTVNYDQNEDNISNNPSKEINQYEEEISDQNPNVKVEQSEGDLPSNESSSEEKKVKANLEQKLKGKHTIPQPFSLATEKRKPRERKYSEESGTKLSKSLAFRDKSQSPLKTVQTQTSLRLERITEVRQSTSKSGSNIRSVVRTQSSLRVERSTEIRKESSKFTPLNNNQGEKQSKVAMQRKDKNQQKEVEVKRSTKSTSKIEKDPETNKLKKSSTFKASPLPSFYHRRSASSKLECRETKEEDIEASKQKKSSTFKASPLPGFYHKRSASLKHQPGEKEEEIGRDNLDKSTTTEATQLRSYSKKAPFKKPELIKIPVTQSKSLNHELRSKREASTKTTSRIISSNAKETLQKLLEGPWKASTNKSKKEPKRNIVSGGTANGKGEASTNLEEKEVISINS